MEEEQFDHPLAPQEGHAERMDIDDDISRSVGGEDVVSVGIVGVLDMSVWAK